MKRFVKIISAVFLYSCLYCIPDLNAEELFPSTKDVKIKTNLENLSVGDWSEWDILINDSPDNHNGTEELIRLRLELTSIKEGKFYYNVHMKMKNRIELREGVEVDLKSHFENLINSKNESKLSFIESKSEMTYKMLYRTIRAVKEKIKIDSTNGGAFIERILSPEFKSLPVYLKTDKIEIKLLDFGKGIAPSFPLNAIEKKTENAEN